MPEKIEEESLREQENLQKHKLLLDTPFLLPILGFETSDRIMKAYQKLRPYKLHYNNISILEALWKIAEKVKMNKRGNFTNQRRHYSYKGNHETHINQWGSS